MDGDVSGAGLTGGYTTSLEECKSDCDDRSDCNSFVYGIRPNGCKLLHEAEPTDPPYLSDQFCKKAVPGICIDVACMVTIS